MTVSIRKYRGSRASGPSRRAETASDRCDEGRNSARPSRRRRPVVPGFNLGPTGCRRSRAGPAIVRAAPRSRGNRELPPKAFPRLARNGLASDRSLTHRQSGGAPPHRGRQPRSGLAIRAPARATRAPARGRPRVRCRAPSPRGRTATDRAESWSKPPLPGCRPASPRLIDDALTLAFASARHQRAAVSAFIPILGAIACQSDRGQSRGPALRPGTRISARKSPLGRPRGLADRATS